MRPARTRSLLMILAVVSLVASAAHAIEPGERLSDPGQEARARALSAGLRCLVCQNQSIDDSNAPLARDLRLIVREQIAAGRSDKEVLDFVVARYGEFVLLRPPLGWHTLLLWLAPLLILLAAAMAIVMRMRAPRAATPPLTPEEQARLDRILKDGT